MKLIYFKQIEISFGILCFLVFFGLSSKIYSQNDKEVVASTSVNWQNENTNKYLENDYYYSAFNSGSYGSIELTGCSITSLTAVPGNCNSTTNAYTLTGTVQFSNPPNSGTLTVQITGGGSQVFNAPFGSSKDYSISDQVADGASYTVTATFSANTNCTKSKTYNAPAACLACPNNSCISNDLESNGNMESGNPPSNWVVANGTPSSEWTQGTGSSTGNFGILNNDDDNTDRYIEQFITSGITANTIYTLKSLGATHAAAFPNAIAEIYMELYNGNTLLATSSKSNTTHNYDGTLLAMSDIMMTSTANTTKIRIVGHSRGRALKLDNIVLVSCAPCACIISSITATPGSCNVSTNNYSLTGAVTFANAPTTGTLTVQITGGSSQVFNAPFTSPINYSIGGQTSDGSSHTVTATFSSNANCTKNKTYTAPANCVCSISAISATAGGCNSMTNNYTVSGGVTFTNAPSSGTLTVQITGGDNQVFNAPFSSPINYSISGQTSDGASHTVTAIFSADQNCTKATNYTAPVSCINCPYSCLTNNLVINGNMESGTPPSNWVVANGTPSSEWTLGTGSSTGNFGILNNDDDNTDRYIEQFITSGITANTIYTLKALGATHAAAFPNAIAEIYMELYNGNTLVGTSSKSNTTHNYDGTLLAMSDIMMTSTANTTKIRIVGHSRGRALKLDNVVLVGCIPCPCVVNSITATAGTCNPSTNNYTLTGTVTFNNAPSSGTLTVQITGGGSQVFTAPFASPINYSINGQTSDGLSHTVTATFSGDPNCTKNNTYTAPPNCQCLISAISATPGSCNPATNSYTLTGKVTFNNAPSTGTLTVQIIGGGSQVFTSPFTSPINYSISGQASDGLSHTVTATFSADPNCTKNNTYTAPPNCQCLISAISATPGTCNPSTNNYILTGTVTFTNAPSSGTLTVQITGGGSQVFTAPFGSPINYSISGQASDGSSHTVTAIFSADQSCTKSKTYTAPPNCSCTVNTISATAGACNSMTNNYTVSGGVTFTNAPSSGTLTVQITGGDNQVFNAPFSSPINYSISGQTSDGLSHTISATFSADQNCTKTTNYTAPVSCITCPYTCVTDNLVTNGNMESGNPPSNWVVANGTPSSEWTLGTGSSTGNFGILNNDDDNTDRYIEQFITSGITANTIYTLKALGATHAAAFPNAIAEIYMELYNGNTLVGTSSKSNTTHNYDGTLLAMSDIMMTSTANTTKIRIVGHSRGRALKLDNVVLVGCIPCPCVVNSITATAGTCNPSTNNYTLTGTVTFNNAPSSGTLTVQITGGGSQVFTAPFTSPINYSINGQTSDGLSHTVTATFSGDPNCTKNNTYTAPPNCQCLISAISATPGTCNPSTNNYILTGTVTFTNAPSSGTLTVQITGGGSQVFTAPFGSPINYSISGQASDGSSHTVTAIFSADQSCTKSKTYTAPPNCSCTVNTISATAGACNSMTNNYTVSGGVTFTNAPSSGTLTVQITGGDNQVFNAPFSSPINYSISGQTSDGLSHTISATFSADQNCTKTTNYTAPVSCITCPYTCVTDNLVTNGNMESGNPPSNWVVANGTPSSEWTLGTGSSTGNFGILNNDDDNTDRYIEQFITSGITANTIYTLKALGATHSAAFPNAIAEIYMELYNGNTLLATSSKSNTTHNYDGTLLAMSDIMMTSTANTTKIRIVGHSRGRALKLDNVVLVGCIPCPCVVNSITAAASACNPATNSYTLTGKVTFNNAPSTGTLTVQITGGGSQVFTAPFTSPINYSINGQTSDGLSHTVTATFSGDPNCTKNNTYTAPPNCQCLISAISATAGPCDPASNNYTLTGTVTFTNPPSTGTLTVQITGGGSQVFTAPFTSSINYSINGQTSDGLSHTVTATFSGDPNCTKNNTYTAPPNCQCLISAISATPGTCNPSTNNYTLTGAVTFTNAPSSGTLTVQITGGGSQVFTAPFGSPINYSISGQSSDGSSHTVTAIFSADQSCTKSKTYTAPQNCQCLISAITATAGPCDPASNNYTLTGTVTFTNPPSTGTLTVQITGGGSQVFTAPFGSPINYSISGQASDGSSHTVTAIFSADQSCTKSKTYTAPPNCQCLISAISATAGPCDPASNNYTLTGTVTFNNAPSTGTLNVQITGGSIQVFTAPFTSPINYSISGQASDGSSHTVTASFSVDESCSKSKTYTAPPNCQCLISAISATPGSCYPATNSYTLTGTLTFNNAPSTGILTVQITGGGSQVFTAPFTSPVNYTIGGQNSDGFVHTVTATFSADPNCTKNTTYTAPYNCSPKITHKKEFISATATGLNTYEILYRITVTNTGGAGLYNLSDAPVFDNDIDITSANYSCNAVGNPGNPGPVVLAGAGPWTLATNQSIGATSIQTYNIRINVSINLEDARGDNIYQGCGSSVFKKPVAGEGLFNESRLDVNRDGIIDARDTACGDLPYIVHHKSIVGVTTIGTNTYQVEYRITVENKGGVATLYNLSDAPAFDNDINITSANYFSNAVGNAGNPGPFPLAGTGPWTLATNQSIGAGVLHTYNLRVNVTINLEDASGDNRYDECGKSNGRPKVGEGLFNESRLDINRDGIPDARDTACADLPFIIHSKDLVGVTPIGVNSYQVEYKITVVNKGGSSTQYNLSDAPAFDNDINITSANYFSNAAANPGNPGPVALAGSGPWNIATNQSIGAGVTQTFNIRINVSINLEDASGDNRYDPCGKSLGIPRAGEGLFNESRLDVDRDGITDARDTACADIPYLIHSKSIVGVSPVGGLNNYLVEYRITVENRGGTATQYNLSDAPNFDNDIAINAANYSSNAFGNPGNPGPVVLGGTGPWTLATNQAIGVGVVQTYNIKVNVSIDLLDAIGDNRYDACGKSNGKPKAGEGLFNESRLDINGDGIPDARDTACADLPFLIHNKKLVGVTNLGLNNFIVEYKITVENKGGTTTQYNLSDAPNFDNDITINSANYSSNALSNPGNPGPFTLIGTGPWFIAVNQSIGGGGIQTYNIRVNVTLNLNDALGDNRYDECGKSNGRPKAGEGLFNESRLDINRDGVPDARDTACADLPFILHTKSLVGVTNTGINTFQVEYKITVENKGGVATQYNLSDAPAFDNDISITSANYSSNATGNPANPGPVILSGTGPWPLATNQSIAANGIQTYNIRINVSMNLEDANGDNRYDKCGKSSGRPQAGEGLFNESRLDVDRDGITDAKDTACADLPYLLLSKYVVIVNPTGLNTFQVEYKITVENKGGVATQYNLSDAPAFDNDITILSANYSSNAFGNPGTPGPLPLFGTGPWTLAINQNIGAGITQVYSILVNVNINLEDAVGDNRYDPCGKSQQKPIAGEGLFNEARLDVNRDGIPDKIATACADLPYIVHTKSLVGVTTTGVNTYQVEYKITVENKGGVSTQYNLSDAPAFDDDISITSANYISNASANPGNPGPIALFGAGPWTLANNQNINPGVIQTYNIRINVSINLEDAKGDNRYDECGKSLGIPKAGEGLFNESRLDLNRDGITDARDTACGDIPYLVHNKELIGVTTIGVNIFQVDFKITVQNKGGVPTQYNLSDAPGFDNDAVITSANYFSNAIGNPANPGPIALFGAGPWTLATNQNIGARESQTYNLRVNITISLEDEVGDNHFDECGKSNGTPKAGEGLFNESRLDINRDGIPDRRDTVCGDPPLLVHTKSVVGVTNIGMNTFQVEYKIVVQNKGDLVTSYNLSDAPAFDNDINILTANYSSNAFGNPGNPGPLTLVGNGPWILATDQIIGAGVIHTYNIKVNVTINLEDALGDNRYDQCGKSLGIPRAGEGLFNESRLDVDRDGITDKRDTACVDLPYIIHHKNVIGVTQTGARTFAVDYRVTVQNIGGANGFYGLFDRPAFDDDITIANAFYSSNAPGHIANPGPVSLFGTGPWTLAVNQLINAGATHTYTLRVNVNINLEDAFTGNNIYTECGKSIPGHPRTGEGLFNESGLDVNNDGIPDRKDTACADVPYIVHKKSIIGLTGLGSNNFKAVYGVEVKNLGGASGQYDLVDKPGFDDDVKILNASYTSTASGNVGNPGPVGLVGGGPWTLANDQTIGAFSTQFYTLTVNVNIDLSSPQSPGDKILRPCGYKIPGVPSAGEGLFNQTTLDVNNDGITDQRDSVCTNIDVAGLGDTVWNDLNGDGVQQPGEPGVKNVIAVLYDCSTGQIVRKDTTDNNGFYFFENLTPAKDYFVRFDLSLLPPGFGFTLQDKGGNDAKDSDVNASGVGPCTRLDVGERDSTYDAGLVLLATLGDFVWHDRNADGMQSAGEEGIAGVPVSLYDAATNTVVKSTVTDVNGLYLFKDLIPKDYYVKFQAPAGWSVTIPNAGPDYKDSDLDNSNGPGTTATTHLSPGEDDRTWDLGLTKCISIFGDIWFDKDLDGIYDPEEKGINGLKVYLIDATTNATVASFISSTKPGTPSDDGYYNFSCVKAGTYYLQFERPGNLGASLPYQGTDPNKDSDITHENGLNTTKKFTLQSGDVLSYIGAGFQIKSTVGDKVWVDYNGNGIQDDGDAPLAGVKVSAYNNKGAIVSQSMTATDGHYILDGMTQGDYYVKFEVPNQKYTFTKAHAGIDNIDSDVDGTNGYGSTRILHILPGEVRPHVDAGVVASPLALNWFSFKGTYNGDFTELDWTTGVEIDNDYFVVERKYETEKEFREIARVKANSNPSLAKHDYEYDDFEVNRSGMYYYRLKQMDNTGIYTYSQMISVRVSSPDKLNAYIYPNPVNDLLKIELWIPQDSDLDVRVIDENGKVVLTAPFNGFKLKGKYSELLEMTHLSPGQYVIQLKTSLGLINKKFTVSR